MQKWLGCNIGSSAWNNLLEDGKYRQPFIITQTKNNLRIKNMKLAEALSIRKDLQKRVQQLGQRIQNNVKVQEGDEPSELPEELMKELDH